LDNDTPTHPEAFKAWVCDMEKMNIAALLDKHFPMHGNWQLKWANREC